MALDDSVYIGEWNSVNDSNVPGGDESRKQGDNQIRSTKGVCKRTFPNLLGAVTPDHTELNTLEGIVTDKTIETRLSNAEFEPGTGMAFYNASAPTGWTTSVINTGLLMVVNGATTGGTQTGTDEPDVMDTVPSHNHGVTVVANNAPHSHRALITTNESPGSFEKGIRVFDVQSPSTSFNTYQSADVRAYIESSNANHTHSASSAPNAGGADWEPRVHHFVLGTKDAY